MRLLEGFIFIFNIIFIILLIKGSFKKVKATKYISLITFVLFILHIIIDKLRWQLYPLYLITILSLIITIVYMTSVFKIKDISSKSKKLIISIMIFFIIISGISAYVFPVYKMPLPSGQYKIGTESFDITDPERKAIYSNDLNNNRKIKIQAWYPAQTTKDFKRVPWLEDGEPVAKALAKGMNFPSFLLDHTALVMSNSFEKAPINNELEKYPVVIISHGWTGFRDLHTDVAEELASNGYIVIGIDHTYGSMITIFNDGEVDYLNREALPETEDASEFLKNGNKLVNTYAGDVNLTLNELEKFNDGEINSEFKGKIDLSRIALLGHSTGGGADVSIALKDKRIKAIVGMDAWVEPINAADLEEGFKIPSLFIRSGEWEVGENNKNLSSLIDKSNGLSALYQINDTKHIDFTMVYMYSPLTKYVNITGKLDGSISSLIQRDFIKNFFDKNLKANNSIDMDNVADKWEVVKKIK